MALTEWDVIWDLKVDGSGYEGVKSGEKFKKGETIPATEPETGLRGKVFTCKYARIKAEGEEEACKVAQEAYGTKTGVSAVPHAEKELKFFAV